MQQTPDDDTKRGPEQPSQPLYEYSTPPSHTNPDPSEDGPRSIEPARESEMPQESPFAASEQYGPLPEIELETPAHSQNPSEEDIRQGLVYPPPPSFYLNMPDQPAPPPAKAPGPSIPLSNTHREPAAPLPVPPYARSQTPPIQQSIPPLAPVIRRRSNKWVWFSLAIFGVITLISCGLCTWAATTFMSPLVSQTTDSLTTVNDYYTAIQSRHYEDAYSYIEPKGKLSGLTLDRFVAQAQARDSKYGEVFSFTTRTNQVDAQPGNQGFSSLGLTLDVTRSKLKYTVKLTIEKIGTKYKIVAYDQI